MAATPEAPLDDEILAFAASLDKDYVWLYDHTWELQLGGPDTRANLRLLDAFTNWHLGTQQIARQLRNVVHGTSVRGID